MGVFDNFVYTNFHEMNLDWIVRKVFELEKKVDTMKTDDLIGKFDLVHALKGSNIVVFGDSWSTGTGSNDGAPPGTTYEDNRYSSTVAKAFDMKEFNFGISGSGYTRPNTIADQIDYADGHMTDDEKINTKVVSLIAGVNDIRNYSDTTLADFESAVLAAVNSCSTLFPNALILLGIGCVAEGMADEMYNYLGYASQYALTGGKRVQLLDLVSLFTGRPDLFRSDKVHPNYTGHKELAGLMISSLLGGTGLPLKYLGKPEMNTGYTIHEGLQVYKVGPFIHLAPGRIDIASAQQTTGNRAVGDMPSGSEHTTSHCYSVMCYGTNIHGTSALNANHLYINPDTAGLSYAMLPGFTFIADA